MTKKRAICFTKGHQNKLYDSSSREYVDFSGGGENCLGYGLPLMDLLQPQLGKLVNSPLIHDSYNTALNSLTNKDSHFTPIAIACSPIEANMLALKVAQSHFSENPKQKFVYASKRGIFNDLNAVKSSLDSQTAGIIVEPVCDNGVIVADYDFLINAYAYAKSLDILFICDETRIGLGRVGSRFLFQTYGIQPDIITLGKGLSAGLNAGAVLVKKGLSYKQNLDFTPANALACCAITEVNNYLTSEKLSQIEQTGDYLLSKLVKLSKHNFVLDIRGKGLLAVIELNGRVSSAKIASQLEKSGFLVALTEKNTIKICPPLTITRPEIDALTATLTQIFASTNI